MASSPARSARPRRPREAPLPPPRTRRITLSRSTPSPSFSPAQFEIGDDGNEPRETEAPTQQAGIGELLAGSGISDAPPVNAPLAKKRTQEVRRLPALRRPSLPPRPSNIRHASLGLALRRSRRSSDWLSPSKRRKGHGLHRRHEASRRSATAAAWAAPRMPGLGGFDPAPLLCSSILPRRLYLLLASLLTRRPAQGVAQATAAAASQQSHSTPVQQDQCAVQ